MEYREKIIELMLSAKTDKELSKTDVEARRWAVFYTELEKALGYYEAFLEPKVSGIGGDPE
jgi:hypothetical protein